MRYGCGIDFSNAVLFQIFGSTAPLTMRFALNEKTKPQTRGAEQGTRDALMRAAERLVAERGFAAVSVRDIVSEAGANIAAINYHFGSKSGLLDAVFEERSAEHSRERLRGLKRVLATHDGPAPLPEILAALFGPVVNWLHSSGEHQSALLFCVRARLEGTQRMRETLNTMFEVHWRFVDAIADACPQFDRDEIHWRMFLALGMEHESVTAGSRLRGMSQGRCNTDDPNEVLSKLVELTAQMFDSTTR